MHKKVAPNDTDHVLLVTIQVQKKEKKRKEKKRKEKKRKDSLHADAVQQGVQTLDAHGVAASARTLKNLL